MFKLLTKQLSRSVQTGFSRQLKTTPAVFMTKQTPDQLIDVTKALEGWEFKLKQAGVGDTDFNLKCLVSHVLKKKFVSI